MSFLLKGLVDSFFSTVSGCRRFLDIGCRYGWAGHLFLHYNHEAEVIGLDIYLPYLRALKEFSRAYHVIQADASHLPFREKAFDLIAAIEVLEHLSKPSALKLLREMDRVSSSPGYIMVTTPNGVHPTHTEELEPMRHKSAWSPRELRRHGFMVKGYGFRPIRLRQKLPKLFRALDLVFTPLSRRFPSIGYGLTAVKKR